jgi:hypothetical protein
MEATKIIAVLVLLSLSTHSVMQTVMLQRPNAEREKLGRLTRHVGQLNEARRQAGAQSWHAADFSRYFVPAGLRLDQARRAIREARNSEEDSNSP